MTTFADVLAKQCAENILSYVPQRLAEMLEKEGKKKTPTPPQKKPNPITQVGLFAWGLMAPLT